MRRRGGSGRSGGGGGSRRDDNNRNRNVPQELLAAHSHPPDLFVIVRLMMDVLPVAGSPTTMTWEEGEKYVRRGEWHFPPGRRRYAHCGTRWRTGLAARVVRTLRTISEKGERRRMRGGRVRAGGGARRDVQGSDTKTARGTRTSTHKMEGTWWTRRRTRHFGRDGGDVVAGRVAKLRLGRARLSSPVRPANFAAAGANR